MTKFLLPNQNYVLGADTGRGGLSLLLPFRNAVKCADAKRIQMRSSWESEDYTTFRIIGAPVPFDAMLDCMRQMNSVTGAYMFVSPTDAKEWWQWPGSNDALQVERILEYPRQRL